MVNIRKNTPQEKVDLLIIDEISFQPLIGVHQMEERMSHLKYTHFSPFGCIDMLFCGDVNQLEPTPRPEKEPKVHVEENQLTK